MSQDISKAYEPQEIEKRWAQAWVDEGLYSPERSAEFRPPDAARGAFSIALPPPNVTGSIHIGHMLEHTQIDLLVRWRRMLGHRTLWLPGMDHAGIATQVVVERKLAEQKLTRKELGREEFERRVWEWKAESGGTIKRQMIRLGASCDWSRETFTLDPPLYRAVMEAFLRLYREGLIYRGRYMVNWCPRCHTALSDLEVVHKEHHGHLWHIRYPVAGAPDTFITVATTRPETMLGDTAVAVHPEDERYRSLVGKHVVLPLMNREIPVIADEAVDREFGTGTIKVTPAHDSVDFEIGRRHNLPQVDLFDDEAKMTAAAGAYAGLDRYAARKKVIHELEALGLLAKTEPHTHSIGICDRCKTVVEPRVSTQWFCKMKPLADNALAAVRDGLISITPDNEKKKFFDWMENIRDWCISRQLWWGHRIPVWHCADCGGMTTAMDSDVALVDGRAQIAHPPAKCGKCGSAKIGQDPDVLDTWFSSGLWPFSTLGWPDDTSDLRQFYPTSLLISGYDILFFWDARMIMMGLHLVGRPEREQRIPFRSLYLHALVRDAEGTKMSKTRGNVVDPLHIIELHGTDALRFTLAVMAAPGTDIALSEDRIKSYRAFANKIWNAARFLFVNLAKAQETGITLEELAAPEIRAGAPYESEDALYLVNRWIFSRLARVSGLVNAALDEFRFHEAAHEVYHFFWGDFCDWYIEWVKPHLTVGERANIIRAWRNLFAVFEAALRLLHPFMPFLTEELWHRLPQRGGARSISLEPFPQAHPEWLDDESEQQFALLQEIVTAARNIRAEMKLEPKKAVPAEFSTRGLHVMHLLLANTEPVMRLATLSGITANLGSLPAGRGVLRHAAQFDLRIALDAALDVAAESARLRKEIERLAADIAGKRTRLADDAFRSRAPEKVVRDLEATLESRSAEHQKLLARLAEIEGAASNAAG